MNVTSLSFRQMEKPAPLFGTVSDIIKASFGSFEGWIQFECAEGRLIQAYRDAKTSTERWAALRAFYAFYRDEIAQKPADVWVFDPYSLPVHQHFTPIEDDAWGCIRTHGLVMYPQFPALGCFLDFANPVLKVAIEMDGKRWHDPIKDAQRYNKLIANGWTVYHIPGAHCLRRLPDLETLREQFDEDSDEYWKGLRDWLTKTSEGVICAIGFKHFREAAFEYEGDFASSYSELVGESLALHRSVKK